MSKSKKKMADAIAKPTVSSVDPMASEPISVTWSLAELPSPQHRAGLAGLVMLVKYTLRHNCPNGAILKEVSLDESRYELQMNISGLSWLFDKVYRATVGESFSKTQRKDKKTKEPKRHLRVEVRKERSDKGKEKEVSYYVYPALDPHGGPLTELTPQGDDGKWMKLWRQWLWDTIRSRDRQRIPYKTRAEAGIEVTSDEENEGDGEDEGDVQMAWSALSLNKGIDQASTYFLGAEKVNAENIPFTDVGRNWFLLHFWPFCIHVFQPRSIDAFGKYKSNGYVACVPDVTRIMKFIARYEHSLRHERTVDADRIWKNSPKQSIVDLADAAALESERWLEGSIEQRAMTSDARATAGFQVIHAERKGNSVRIRSNRMITPTREMTNYAHVVGGCRSHLAKHQVLVNILSSRRWWEGFDRVCATNGKDLTIKDKGFCDDAQLLFTHFHHEDRPMPDPVSDTPKVPRSLESIILAIVTSWIAGRLDSKYNLSWDAVKGSSLQAEYDKRKSKLATDAFLAARSRPGREFARWFTATLCSVNQRSISNEIDFIALSKALEEHPDQVRSLTLLALSARG